MGYAGQSSAGESESCDLLLSHQRRREHGGEKTTQSVSCSKANTRNVNALNAQPHHQQKERPEIRLWLTYAVKQNQQCTDNPERMR